MISSLVNTVSLLRRFASLLRHAPDRTLHTYRRRRALARLARAPTPRTVVFLCLGNICRSPFAAAAFRRALPLDLRNSVRVESAGFIGADRPAPPHALHVAGGFQIDLEDHRSRPITPAVLGTADLIVVMSAEQRRRLCATAPMVRDRILILGDLDPLPIHRRTVRDPFGHDADVFEEVYTRIDRCAVELARAMGAR